MVAQAYALKYPSAVSKLILADTFYSGEMWQQANNDNSNHEIRNQFPEIWAKVQELRNMGMHSSAKEHQEAYDVPGGLLYFHDASVAEHLPKDFFQMNPDVYYTIVGDDGDFLIGGDIAKLDFRTQLRGLHMPVLVVNGRYDRVSVPRFSLKFKQYAPQAEIVMFEHSGHSPFIEEPDAFFATLRTFLGASSAK
jgi:proline iminopeptidase